MKEILLSVDSKELDKGGKLSLCQCQVTRREGKGKIVPVL